MQRKGVVKNDKRIRLKAGKRRTRHPKANGEFTPANDAYYQVEVREIQREFEQRMSETERALPGKTVPESIRDFPRQFLNGRDLLKYPKELADDLKQRAILSREQEMINAYDRHDMRKGGWTARMDSLKREIARRRYDTNTKSNRKEIQTDQDLNKIHPTPKITRQDKTLAAREEAYARQRPMPSVAEQKAGFPRSSSSSSSPPGPATHQMSLLQAAKNNVLHVARSSLHQLEHAAKSVLVWEKRASKSRAVGVQKVGPLEGAELKAVESW
ncbi:MAG: hypothetical protein M1826_000982 [Phylliscum demangeonii]|nr:MAG: hypothetical protein M1826_000982 [Phylliscum demangeonii]